LHRLVAGEAVDAHVPNVDREVRMGGVVEELGSFPAGLRVARLALGEPDVHAIGALVPEAVDVGVRGDALSRFSAEVQMLGRDRLAARMAVGAGKRGVLAAQRKAGPRVVEVDALPGSLRVALIAGAA